MMMIAEKGIEFKSMVRKGNDLKRLHAKTRRRRVNAVRKKVTVTVSVAGVFGCAARYSASSLLISCPLLPNSFVTWLA